MEFLKSITAKEAHQIIQAFPINLKTETIGIDDAQGRVLAEAFIAAETIPPFNRSLVDGYAVKAKDVQGAKETSPAFLNLIGEVRIGEKALITISAGDCVYVSTGSMVPEGSDAIVMQEQTRRVPDAIEITKAVFQGENICYAGEDIQKGVTVILKGKRITPLDAGVFAALGVTSIPVYRKPKIALISSGDEIVGIDKTPSSGKVRDINRYTISALVQKEGAQVIFLGLARDSISDITEKLVPAQDYDMILISGGSSKGERDFITASIEKLGGEIVFHGINIKPGKPTIFGKLFGKPIFGLPGHPSSCAMVTVRFVLPLVRHIQGDTEREEKITEGVLTANVPSSYGIEEYPRVTLKKTDEVYRVTPVFSKSALISSLSRADGYIIVPEGAEGLEKGEPVEVHFFA
jgi:molybdopterin molybdotransferase